MGLGRILGAEMVENMVDQVKAIYPRRDGGHGWGAVGRLLDKAIACGAEFERILQGTRNYLKHCQRKGVVGTEFVMQARTFYGRDQHWDEWADQDMRTPGEIAAERQWADLERRAKALGYSVVDRSQGLSVAEYAIQQAEKKPRLKVVQ